MKPKTLILMVVAVVCGLGASYMTTRLLADRANQSDQPEMVTVKVLVAKTYLPQGEKLTKPQEKFVEKDFLPESVPAKAIKEFGFLKDRLLKSIVRKDTPITEDDLIEKGANSSLPYRIPDGMVACGINVNNGTTASGFASRPGSRVDIQATTRRGIGDPAVTEFLFQNVEVLAADVVDTPDETKRFQQASVVTVALKHEDSLKLKQAASMGEISLVLRAFGDNRIYDTPRISGNEYSVGSGRPRGADGTEDTKNDPTRELPDVPIGSPPPKREIAEDPKREAVVQEPGAPTPARKGLVDEPKREEVVRADVPPPARKALAKPLYHDLTVTEGGSQTKTRYQLDPVTRKVIDSEITRSVGEPPTRAGGVRVVTPDSLGQNGQNDAVEGPRSKRTP